MDWASGWVNLMSLRKRLLLILGGTFALLWSLAALWLLGDLRHELERVLEAAREAGATSAGYILLRLPHEVAPLFRDWLQAHLPDRAEHVMSTVQQMRGGRDYDSGFGTRMRGQGRYADLLEQRFALAWRRFGYAQARQRPLACSRFQPPRPPSPQGELF